MKIIRLSRSSWFKLNLENMVIHFDPGYTGFLENQKTPLQELEEKADWVFITHSHLDHYRTDVLEKITDEHTIIVAPFTVAEQIMGQKILVTDKSMLTFPSFTVDCLPAYNTPTGHSIKKYHSKGAFVGYFIRFKDQSIYFAGDTDLIPEMEKVKNVDIAFLPIGGTYVMDGEEALEAVDFIQPKTVVLMHEANENPILLAKKVSSPTRVIVLTVGETHIENQKTD